MTATDLAGTRPAPAATGERDYHAFTTCQEPAGWLLSVQDQLGSWLRAKKRLDIDLRTDGTHTDPREDRTVAVRHHRNANHVAVRFVMEERNATGHWTTDVIAVENERGGGWVSVSVTSAQGLTVLVPGVARNLLQTLPLRDGHQELTDAPRLVRADQVDDLVSLLTDPTRRGGVFVAGTDDRLPFSPFARRVAGWSEQITGLGHVALLEPAATVALEERLGQRWTTPAWTVRTYLPALDLTQSATSRQHRILGTERLGKDSDRYLRTLLGGFARQVIAQHAAPRELTAWQRTFDRLDNSAITAAMTLTVAPPAVLAPPTASPPAGPSSVSAVPAAPAAPVTPPAVPVTPPAPPLTEEDVQDSTVGAEADQYLADLERVRLVLGLADLSDDALRALAEQAAAPRIDPRALADAARRIEKFQQDKEDLQAALDASKAALLDEQVDHMEDREELERQADKATWLGRQLAEVGRHDIAYASVPEQELTVYPNSYADLLQAAASLADRGVIVTADSATVLGLEGVDSTSKALRAAWDALLALADFISARQAGLATAAVHHYLVNTPHGFRGFTPGKHAWTETGVTMQQFGEERDLPVPTSVDPRGWTTMRSHFKLARIGMVSPRLYYYDDVAGSGRIYVGYIGPHLTNTQT